MEQSIEEQHQDMLVRLNRIGKLFRRQSQFQKYIYTSHDTGSFKCSMANCYQTLGDCEHKIWHFRVCRDKTECTSIRGQGFASIEDATIANKSYNFYVKSKFLSNLM